MHTIHNIAPIRSKPKRTYNPLKEAETPDGSEIPIGVNEFEHVEQEGMG